TLFFETADHSEIDRRCQPEVFITEVEVPIGLASPPLRSGSLPHIGKLRICSSSPIRQPRGDAEAHCGVDDERSRSVAPGITSRHATKYRKTIRDTAVGIRTQLSAFVRSSTRTWTSRLRCLTRLLGQ